MRRQLKAMAMSGFLGFAALYGNTVQATPLEQGRQVDIGHTVPSIVVVIQTGGLVGLVWARGSVEEPCSYTEYWYLSSDYIYPGSEGPGETIATTLRPFEIPSEYETPSDFFGFARSLMPVGKRIVMPVFELENCGSDGFEP
jgi:hypothetical protein